MYKKFILFKIDSKYCDYLRKYDNKVVYNAERKHLRPFVGILLSINNLEYFAPLSSPKEKHKYLKNKLDLIKIKDGEYGVVNLNNMIPVTNSNYVAFDLDNIPSDDNERKRYNILTNQLRWLTSHKKEVMSKTRLLYNLYANNKIPKNVVDRCFNYVLLESASLNYPDNHTDK